MNPQTFFKNKSNIYYLEDGKIVRCFVSKVDDAGYTLQHFDDKRTEVFCAHGEERVFYKSVRSASKAKIFNDDPFKLDFVCSKIGSKLFYMRIDHEKETAFMEKCKITDVQDDVSNHTRIYTLQPYGKTDTFQVSGSHDYSFFDDGHSGGGARRGRK